MSDTVVLGVNDAEETTGNCETTEDRSPASDVPLALQFGDLILIGPLAANSRKGLRAMFVQFAPPSVDRWDSPLGETTRSANSYRSPNPHSLVAPHGKQGLRGVDLRSGDRANFRFAIPNPSLCSLSQKPVCGTATLHLDDTPI